jgi:hypothetical protein
MNFHPVSLFDTVEGENTVWTQLQAALHNKDGDTFYRLPIVDQKGRFMFEPDMVVALRGCTPVVIECKGCRLPDIASIEGAVWTMAESWYRAQENPLNQARSQAIALSQMLAGPSRQAPKVHSLVVLPFVSRDAWNERFGTLGINGAIVFANDIVLPERLAARIVEVASECKVGPGEWNRFGRVLGACDRWIVDTDDSRPVTVPHRPRPIAEPTKLLPEGQGGPGINILRYAGRPPSAAEIRAAVGIAPEAPYTYLVATAALERQRCKDGLGGQHQLKKQMSVNALYPEEMQLLFHKAIRHFIARPMLTRTEERVLIQRAIRALAQGDRVVAEQLRRDVFAWRDVLAEMEEEGVDLSVGGASSLQWAHPDLRGIATQLQATYRKMRRSSGRAKSTFEESARHYLQSRYVPTPIVVMEGFTRLTPLQQEFIERCAQVDGLCLWIVLPHNPDQQPGFAALDRTYERFVNRARLLELSTLALGEQPSLAHLQTGLFSQKAAPRACADDAVSLRAFPHRNDEVANCVSEVIRLIHQERCLVGQDIAIVCSDPQGMAPLLREEAELLGFPDLFTIPPRQLLLTPVGRFILVLYEVWKSGTLEMDAQQLAALLASGWLGGHAQKGAELFVAVSHQHFGFCRSESQWNDAFDGIEQQMGAGDKVLGALAERLPSSLVTIDDLVTWREALDITVRLCKRVFTSGEKPIGDHILLLLDEIEQLDPHRMLQTEREVLADIRAALADIVSSHSVAIDAHEFGEVLSGLIREREDDHDGDLPGSSPGTRPQQVWVVGPEGIDNIERHTVFFLGADESRMPAPGSPPWPRITWSAQEHIERQRYRFLAVVRAARRRLLMSYARQDWEKQHQPSPYLDEAARLLGRSLGADTVASHSVSSQKQPPVAKPIRVERDGYRLSQLAIYRLCPYRFKMEVLTEGGGRYTSTWQLEWLARGIWLAEVFHHVATLAPGPHSAAECRSLIEKAIDAVRPNVEKRLPSLRSLAWPGIEHDLRNTLAYLLDPPGQQSRPLLGVDIPHPRNKVWDVVIGGNRHVKVTAEADFQVRRGTYLDFMKETNQSALWLNAGRHDQAISEDADPDEHLFKTLRAAVKWWTELTYSITGRKPSQRPDKLMELLECIQKLEQGNFRKNPGHHCRYCPVVDTCMGLKP